MAIEGAVTGQIPGSRDFTENGDQSESSGARWKSTAPQPQPRLSPQIKTGRLQPIHEANADLLWEETGPSVPEPGADVPLYIRALHRYFGKTLAESYLQPTISEEKMSPRARVIYEKARALNSEETWKMLREQSKLKLMQLESKLPSDAKLLEKRRFNEMLQNLDGRIGHYRNNLAQIHRISETNQDKMSLIIVNNPLPDLTDMKGNCGPMQYLIKSDSKQV
nr:PREDICTED: uncharacterized protein LOC107078017 [Lepisosteus oculatus]